MVGCFRSGGKVRRIILIHVHTQFHRASWHDVCTCKAWCKDDRVYGADHTACRARVRSSGSLRSGLIGQIMGMCWLARVCFVCGGAPRGARRAARGATTQRSLGSRSAHAPRDAAHMTDVRRHRARPQGQASARPPTAGQGCARPGAAPRRLSLAARAGRRVGSCPRPTGPHRARHARRQPAPTEVKHPQQQTRRDARGGALTALAEPIAV